MSHDPLVDVNGPVECERTRPALDPGGSTDVKG